MRELLDGASGRRLAYDDYVTSIDNDYQRIDEPGFWKLERGQFFREPTSPGWQAFDRGDWDEAPRLAEESRPALEAEYREPLLVRAQSGERMRVVRGEQVAEFERFGRLPEMITLGSGVMWGRGVSGSSPNSTTEARTWKVPPPRNRFAGATGVVMGWGRSRRCDRPHVRIN
jgi:hypothetical protein